MKERLLNLRDLVTGSLWFLPALMTATAIGAALALVQLDEVTGETWASSIGWLWAGSAEGAREVLSTIAGSLITVAGVTFSMLLVALTLAASQFGPQVLRNFMQDTGIQLVLGTFIATFVFCLLVLRTIRTGNGDVFVPYLSVNLALFLTVASLGVLIFFIHHASSMLQSENLVARMARDLSGTIRRLFPQELGEPADSENRPDAETLPDDFDPQAVSICAHSTGYVQAIDNDRLLDTASEADLVIRLLYRPGNFVTESSSLMQAWPSQRCDGKLQRRLASAFVLGRYRTPTQDVEYATQQIVQVAVRALSPGINNPFTATTCIDWLGSGLSQLARRRIPAAHRTDKQGKLRVVAGTTTFEMLADVVFNQIRQYGCQSVPVVLRLLETIAFVATHVQREEDRKTLRHHADMITSDSSNAVAGSRDRGRIHEVYAKTCQALEPNRKRQLHAFSSRASEASDRA